MDRQLDLGVAMRTGFTFPGFISPDGENSVIELRGRRFCLKDPTNEAEVSPAFNCALAAAACLATILDGAPGDEVLVCGWAVHYCGASA